MKPKWNNNQIKTLFDIVEKNNKIGKPNLESFAEYAKIANKNILTVRNFYYSFLKILKNNLDLQNTLDIDIKNHSVEIFEHFDEKQTKQTINDIENLTSQGMSVRSACLKLSGGDYKKMLRLQNKYRNITNQKREKFMKLKQQNDIDKKEIVELLKKEFSANKIEKFNKNIKNLQKNTKNDNFLQNFDKNKKIMVYKFPEQMSKKDFKNKLTDDDIKSLFMGLVNLVKENVKSDNQQKYEAYLEKTQEDKRKHILELEEKQNEIARLNQSINELKAKNAILNKSLQEYRIDYLNNNQNN